LAIASGATPIGSAGRAPDKKAILRKNSTKREKNRQKEKKKLEPMIGYKYSSIASEATYIRSSEQDPMTMNQLDDK
jgi:hypothetical protein